MYVLPTPPQITRPSGVSGLGLMMPRPNQAVDRGVYYFPTQTTVRAVHGLGQTSVPLNTTTLAIGAAVLVGIYYFGGFGAGKRKKRKIASLAAKRTRISQQIAKLES